MNLGDLLFAPDRRFRPLLCRQAEVAVQACALLAMSAAPPRPEPADSAPPPTDPAAGGGAPGAATHPVPAAIRVQAVAGETRPGATAPNGGEAAPGSRRPGLSQGAPAQMARIESAGDAIRRQLTEMLAHTYATPFDRDDIFELSSALDDVADMAQDALLTLCVIGGADYAHVQEMCVSAHEGAWALCRAVERLPAPASREPSRRAKRSENVIGNLYRYGLDLALRTQSPEQALRLREVMSDLRDLSRAIGRAADLVADISVKEK